MKTETTTRTFRTLEGARAWAKAKGLRFEVADQNLADQMIGWTWATIEGESGDALLSLCFETSTGKLRDATAHATHMSHSLGSNTMATLLALTDGSFWGSR